MSLANGANGAVVRPVQKMALPAGDPNRFSTTKFDLRDLTPGDYRLDLSLATGSGGLIRYVALYGGGALAQALAAILGLAAGLAIVCATVVALELVVRGSRLENAA
jgi:hypothetical protein